MSALALARHMLALILGCWIDVDFDSYIGFRLLDVGWMSISTLIPGYQIYIGFDSLALDRWVSKFHFETLIFEKFN
ncbi:uncharacterized protein OCT59_012608 [Rhizophagus irregularis]|uniref:uncharacterized protein n=1 Tax=Rhizophagus irregularis TaxID=588596 RepID=UPI003325EF75|nr:hypothetical protein OCT59_012608 [Rhizophagus irregularis]